MGMLKQMGWLEDFFYVLKGMIYTEVRCSLPKWHRCQSFSDVWHHTVPSNVSFAFIGVISPPPVCSAFLFSALVHWVVFSSSDAKYARGVLYLEKMKGVEFNWQIVGDEGLLSTLSGLWRVTQLGRG